MPPSGGDRPTGRARSRLTTAIVVLPLVLAAASCRSGTVAGPGPASPTAPSGQVLPADYASTVGASGLTELRLAGTRRFPARTAMLRGPHFQYSFVASVTTTRLTAVQAAALRLPKAVEAAPAHELVLAESAPIVGQADAAFYPDGSPDSIEVVGGERTRAVLPRGVSSFTGIVVVSVPAGRHPLLRVTDAGRPQSIDLVTGARGRDAVAAYYPVRGGTGSTEPDQGVSMRYSGPGAAGTPAADRLALLSLGDVDVSLQPWTPEHKWARPGRVWLVLRPSLAYWRPGAGTSQTDNVEVEPRSFAATGPGGTRLPLSGAAIHVGPYTSPGTSPIGEKAGGTLVADVPASLRAATLRFSFHGSIRLPTGPVSWSVYAGGSQAAALSLR